MLTCLPPDQQLKTSAETSSLPSFALMHGQVHCHVLCPSPAPNEAMEHEHWMRAVIAAAGADGALQALTCVSSAKHAVTLTTASRVHTDGVIHNSNFPHMLYDTHLKNL